METNNRKNSLHINRQMPLQAPHAEGVLSPELISHFKQYPENKRRKVNKILYKNDFFHLIYNTNDKSMTISSKGDLVYSAIPYDTCRNYIQRAAIQYLINPDQVHQFVKLHKPILETYLKECFFQKMNKKVKTNSLEVQEAYDAIFQNPLFEIQITGRLLQHDERGALSANLPGKFLFTENVNTGISGYILQYIGFVLQLTHVLPITIDGRTMQLLDANEQKGVLIEHNNTNIDLASHNIPALELLPQKLKKELENAVNSGKQMVNLEPLLKSKYGKELSEVRKNYIAHSIHPEELEQNFDNVLSPKNYNLINVVSDIHMPDGGLPIVNHNFNILAGDIASAHALIKDLKGICVIGNHDLIDILPSDKNKSDKAWKKWSRYYKDEWFSNLLGDLEKSWYMLPVGDHSYYETVKMELEERFPELTVLNNSSIFHKGIRYVGLTVPVAFVKQKKEQQKFILRSMEHLLNKDHDIPTVIVSHAPLFNELSMLTPKNNGFDADYTCSEPKIAALFSDYNIIGAIHGHHHLPASKGQYKIVTFAGKELFVVCSIYSKINTGFDLMRLIREYIPF